MLFVFLHKSISWPRSKATSLCLPQFVALLARHFYADIVIRSEFALRGAMELRYKVKEEDKHEFEQTWKDSVGV